MFLGIDWGKFINLSFWLESNPGELSRQFEIIFVVVLVLGYGLYIAAKVLQKKSSQAKDGMMVNFWRKTARMYISLAIVFSLLFFFRSEGVPYLGGRYMFGLWTIWGLIWLGRLVYYYFHVMPKKLIEKISSVPSNSNFTNKYVR